MRERCSCVGCVVVGAGGAAIPAMIGPSTRDGGWARRGGGGPGWRGGHLWSGQRDSETGWFHQGRIWRLAAESWSSKQIMVMLGYLVGTEHRSTCTRAVRAHQSRRRLRSLCGVLVASGCCKFDSGLTKGPRSARGCGPQALPIRSSRRNGLNGLQHTRRLDRFKRERRVLRCAVLVGCSWSVRSVAAAALRGNISVSARAGMRQEIGICETCVSVMLGAFSRPLQ